MAGPLKGVLTVLAAIVLSGADALLLNLLFGKPPGMTTAIAAGAGFGLMYGLESGIVLSYDLGSFSGWLMLLIDFTWSLPNTVFGFVIGNLVYWFFGYPSTAASQDQEWISFQPYGGSGFGKSVLQTLGTVNLGGEGQHERAHLMQARLFGPLFLAIFAANYIVNSVLQVLFTCTVGLILWIAGSRQTPYLTPSSQSAVGGFFGWIYYYTLFEVWAYSSGNP